MTSRTFGLSRSGSSMPLGEAAVRLDDGVGSMSLRLAEQAHEGDVDALVAEHPGDVRDDARLVLLHDDDCAVLAGEVDLDAVDARDAAFAAAERLAADGHDLTGGVLHADVHGVRMDVGLGFTGRERVGQTALGGDGKRVADTGVIGRETHDAAEQGTVGAVAVVGLGERGRTG